MTVDPRVLLSVLPLAAATMLVVPALAEDELPEGVLPTAPEDTAPADPAPERDATALLPPRADVQAAVAAREPAVQQCARPTDDARWSSGRVLVAWRIEPDGTVVDVEVRQNTTQNEEIGRCLARLVEELEFDETPSGKPARVSYPFEILAPPSRGVLGWLSGLFGCG